MADRLQMTTTQHTIEVDMDAPPLAVTGDRDHLEQVLDNLMTNAIKFSPEGGTIRVAVVGGSAVIYGATIDNTTNDPSIQYVRIVSP